MNPILELLITSAILGIVLGVPLGWIIRSLFVARDIQRISREAWKQARIIQRHQGRL